MVFRFYLKVPYVITIFWMLNGQVCPDTRRSTSGYCMFIKSKCVSWNAKKQPKVSHSSAEAEYRSMAVAASELTWLSSLLHYIGVYLQTPHDLFRVNMSVLYLTTNPAFARTKHVEINFHFVRQKVANRTLMTNLYQRDTSWLTFSLKLCPKLHSWLIDSSLVLIINHAFAWGGEIEL